MYFRRKTSSWKLLLPISLFRTKKYILSRKFKQQIGFNFSAKRNFLKAPQQNIVIPNEKVLIISKDSIKEDSNDLEIENANICHTIMGECIERGKSCSHVGRKVHKIDYVKVVM